MTFHETLSSFDAYVPSAVRPTWQTSAESFVTHFDIFSRWGAVHNLSAKHAPEDVARLHFLDSFLALYTAEDAGWIGERVVDAGSGGGFPGLVLAAAWPDKKVTVVERVAKKCSFLLEAVRVCGLRNVKVLRADVFSLEDMADTVISRATFPWKRLPELHVVAPVVIGLVGQEPSASTWQEKAGPAAERLPYDLPGADFRAVVKASMRSAHDS